MLTLEKLFLYYGVTKIKQNQRWLIVVEVAEFVNDEKEVSQAKKKKNNFYRAVKRDYQRHDVTQKTRWKYYA